MAAAQPQAQPDPRPQGDGAPVLPPPLGGAAGALLASYPGAAIVLAPDGSPAEANAEGAAFLHDCRELPATLTGLRRLAETARAGGAEVRLVATEGAAAVEFLAVPQGDGSTLLLGRDAGLDTSLRRALVESRQRYKDLVDIASDFAWETDANGAFVFVSPHGALGFGAAELVGRRAADLLSEPAALRGRSPFEAQDPVADVEVWVVDKAGRAACLRCTAVPLRDAAGQWRGARGFARDLTRERQRDLALAQREARERVVAYVAEQIRNDEHPLEMLEAALVALSGAVSADGAAVAVVGEAGGFEPALSSGDPRAAAAAAAALASAAPDKPAADLVRDGYRLLQLRTRFRGAWNGAVALARAAAAAPWSEEDRGLAAAVEAQFGVILAQLAYQGRLERMSRTDPLTGLLNRRAFMGDLDRQLMRARRHGVGGALIYLDLDNFKPINDRLGHAKGDEALIAVAQVLAAHARPYDLIARLGGDEFAMWLEEMDETTAVRRAERLIDGIAALPRLGAEGVPALGASIGVAMWDPAGGEAGEPLINRADRAMYAAKAAGKNRAVLDRAVAEAAGGAP